MSLPFYRALRLPFCLLRVFALVVFASMVAVATMSGQSSASSLSAAWKALGPTSITSPVYGELSGRVLSLAVDPNDATGNTVYLGMAGGGVWKSVNAAGPLASVTFAPLTDSLSVFSANAGSSALPSLSIGAVSVQPVVNPVVLAGTGDPNGGNDAHYGEGILRSADGGATWTLAQYAKNGNVGLYTFSGLAVSGFAWSTNAPSLVVAAFADSGEANVVGATGSSSFAGLYYSTDAGQTWAMSTIMDGAAVVQAPLSPTNVRGHAVTSVVWDAQRKQFYAAVREHGYYSSADGVTWTRLASQPGAGLTSKNCPSSESNIGAANCPIYRGSLAVQPSTGDLYAITVDANGVDQGLWQDACNLTNAGMCSSAVPVFANRVDHGEFEASSSNAAIARGSYSLSLAAVPSASDGTLLFVGMRDLFRCEIGVGATACSFRNTTNVANGCNTPAGVAGSQHATANGVSSGGLPLMFFGNDGGLWRSADAVSETGAACDASDASHFENLNAAVGMGGSAAEVIGFAQHPTDRDVLVASVRSGGTVSTSTASAMQPWQQLVASDGGAPLIDQSDPMKWVVSIDSGINYKYCGVGSACGPTDFAVPATVGASQVSSDVSLRHPPTVLDAGGSNLIVGTCRVWRGPAADGSAWSSANAISPAFDGNAACTATSPMIRSLAAGGPVASGSVGAHAGSKVIYAGLAGAADGGALGGHLFVTTSADLADNKSLSRYWTDLNLSPVQTASGHSAFNPQGFDVSSTFVDPHDGTGATVLVTIKGFNVAHVYRSTDFGAHWADLTYNLPNVPTNDVVVDPNDAKTVYVATDAGVYVAQDVGECSSSRPCWNLYGTSLPNAVVTRIQAAPQMLTGDGRQGMLRAATYGRGVWEIPLLSAISVAAPAVTASPMSLTFGDQQVSTLSNAQTVTLTSSGSSPVTISTVSTSGDFSATSECAAQVLAVGSTCDVKVVFAPTATGARSGVLTVYADVAGGQITVPLAGVGTAAASVVLTPASLTFAATVVNQTSAVQIVTVADTGGSSVALQAPSVSGDFTLVANTCGASLAPQNACSLSIAFRPTASGQRMGVLSVVDGAGTQVAQLSGVGQAPATDTLAPGSLAFMQQAVGTVSGAQQLVLTNAGDIPVTLISAKISSSDFSVVNNCGASLAGHASCSLLVSFAPSSVGPVSATLTVSDQFRSQAVALNGIGVAPAGVSLSPLSLVFGATGVGLSAPAQMLTLTNNGGLPLTLSKQSISGDFSVAATSCGSVIAANTACMFAVVFTPAVSGVRSGAFVLTDDAPSGSQTVNLSGTGVDFTFGADGLTTQTVSSGGTATFPLLIKSASGISGNVAFACAGAPAHSVCTVSPSTAALGSTVVVTATVQTGLSSASLRVPLGRNARGAFVLACGVPLLVFGKRRRLWKVASALTCSLAIVSMLACGASRTIPGSGTGSSSQATPTPAGSYAITVTAIAAGLSRSVPLTLVVQ